jgi:hypothetical protein
MPTSDLMSRWPVAVFTWALLVVGLVSVAAAYWYTSAFSPAPISKAHTLDAIQHESCNCHDAKLRLVHKLPLVDAAHGAAVRGVSSHD